MSAHAADDGARRSPSATPTALAAGLDAVRSSPRDEGVVELLVLRPAVERARRRRRRSIVDLRDGTQSATRGGSAAAGAWPDGAADPEAQVTVMNSRAALLVAATRERMPLAGDQVYVDLDLSVDNLPTGHRARLRRRRARGDGGAAHRLREVLRAVRGRCASPDGHAGGTIAAAARHQHAGPARRRHPRRRPRPGRASRLARRHEGERRGHQKCEGDRLHEHGGEVAVRGSARRRPRSPPAPRGRAP